MTFARLAALSLLLPLLFAQPAQAGQKELGQRLKNCKAITSIMNRVQCYDRVVEDYDLENLNRLDVGEAGKWKVTAEKSPITGGQDYFASLVSDDYVRNSLGKYNRPSLVLRCADSKMEGYLIWDDTLGEDNTLINMRIGEGETIAGRWNLSADKQASFIPDAADFVRKLLGQNSFNIKVWPTRGDPLYAVFDIRGSDVALKPLLDACGTP